MPEKITKKAVDALVARAKQEGKTRYIFDSELKGFAVLATKTGTCNYFFEYRLKGAGGSPTRVTLGRHGALTPDEARRRAAVDLGKVADNRDVAQEKKEARKKLTGQTLKAAIERFLELNKQTGRYWVQK